MNYLDLIRKHGLLVSLTILLAVLLAASSGEMLNRFESFRFGPVEAKLRALSLKGRDARTVDAVEAGRQTSQKDTFDLWMSVENSEASALIERAKVISRLRGDGKEPTLDVFDAFRSAVVTPFADLDFELYARGIDLFEQPFAPEQLLRDAMIAIDRNRLDDERSTAVCRTARGLLRLVDGLPDWIGGQPVSGNCETCPKKPDMDALIRNASASIVTWHAKCSRRNQADLLDIASSPYAIVLVDTLIRRSTPSFEEAKNRALLQYLNLLGHNGKIYPFVRVSTRNFDLVGKILVTTIVHRATSGRIPLAQTSEMLLWHYREIERFVVATFDAPYNRRKRYKPCRSTTITGGSKAISYITARNVCERLELVTLPGLMNSLLFSIGEAWIQGRPVERTEINLTESLLPLAEARLDMLRLADSNAVTANQLQDIYFALLDTITLTRLMISVEHEELPSKAKCRTILAAFDAIERHLDEGGGSSPALTSRDVAVWETLAAVRRRQQIAENYCAES